ncbi:methyl-accepting chemotaxis protein [Ideonella sp. DXS29W]|uniref:Methyl-accepting chemotaxis protein n=1 Tax=Ideonella lacteola TaxID=2984193 RepID=A0ABU9C0H9_9BURK
MSVRARLMIVAGMCAMLAVLPASQLAIGYADDIRFVDNELSALPANRAWQEVVASIQSHRQSAAAVATKPEAETQRAAAAQRAMAAFDGVLQALEDRHATTARLEAARSLKDSFAKLAQASSNKGLALAALLQRHRDLSDRVFNEIAELNADSQLLLDPEATAYFSIIAGLQIGPRISDSLSELSSIAVAAAVDDIGAVSSAASRYAYQMDQLMLNLRQASRLDVRLEREFAPVLDQAAQQKQMVEATLAAAAKDVNYPLDKMSQALSDASKLQTVLASEVIGSVESELSGRANALRMQALAMSLLVLGGLAAVAAVLWRTVQGILRPVMTVVSVTERIAAGDLSHPIPQARGDELGRVLAAISTMQDRLRELVQQIQQASSQIRHGAAEIATGNQDLSQRTENAAMSLQQTAASMEQIDDAARLSAEASQHAHALASQASDSAHAGRQVVSAVVSTMDGIQTSSHRISEITGVIDGIAFQTNILALNAAVEAARAGEHGRGFAVVASEVRVLAQRSSSAAREIKQLIQASVERIDSGSRLAGQAGEAMAQIVRGIGEVSSTIATVSTTVQNQSEGLRGVRSAVEQLDGATQQNSALVEQSAAAAESMREQATRLHDLVGVFQLPAR